MTGTQIKCFLSVARERSFSRAAHVLYISQPAVSKQISLLEAELGLTLFIRVGRSVTLTEHGETLRSFLEDTEQAYRGILQSMSRGGDERGGHVRVGCVGSWDPRRFSGRLLRRLEDSGSGVTLSFEGYNALELLKALRDGEIDAALIYRHYAAGQSSIRFAPLAELGTGILCDAALARSAGSLGELAERGFLVSSGSGDLAEHIITEICLSSGITPRIKRLRRPGAEITELLSGGAVMHTDEWNYLRGNGSLTFIPTAYTVPVSVAYIQNSGAVRAFIDAAAEVFAVQSEEQYVK